MAAASESTPLFGQPTSEEVLAVFKEYDTNGDGKLSLDEFRVMTAGLGFVFKEDKAKEILTALDVDGDGSLSATELASFLASSEAAASEAAGYYGVALRTALLSRYAGKVGLSLVRTASSDGVVAPVKPANLTVSTEASIGVVDETSPDAASLSFRITTVDEVPPPPSALTSGKGAVIAFEPFDDADLTAAIDGFKAVLAEEPPPLPPGVSLTVTSVEEEGKELFAFVLDAPIADFPPELGMMFGVGDISEAFKGLNMEATYQISKSPRAIAKATEPIADSVSVSAVGNSVIPHHMIKMLSTIFEGFASSPMGAAIPKEARMLAAVYSKLFVWMDNVAFKYSIESVGEFFGLYEDIAGTLPGPAAAMMMTTVGMIKSFAPGSMYGTIVEQLKPPADLEEDKRALAAEMGKCMHKFAFVKGFAGPMALSLVGKNMELPYLREALSGE